MPIFAYEYDEPLIAYSQIAEGALWQWHRIRYTQENRELYRGDFRSLLEGRPKTAENGLAILQVEDAVTQNWPKRVTEFYVNALFSELPILQGDNEALQAWLDDRGKEVLDASEIAVVEHSIGGYGVLRVTSEGNVVTPRSQDYFPVVSVNDRRTIVGHVLAYPYRQEELDGNIARRGYRLIPDRLRVNLFDDFGTNTQVTFELAGVTIGRQLSVDTPTDTLGMWAFGDGSDAYRDIRPLVGALLISETLGGYTLAQFANPILQGPGVGIAQLTKGGNVEARIARGGLAPRAKEDPPYEWLRPEPAMDQYLEYQQRLIDEIRTHAGLPPSVDGQDVGRAKAERHESASCSRPWRRCAGYAATWSASSRWWWPPWERPLVAWRCHGPQTRSAPWRPATLR